MLWKARCTARPVAPPANTHREDLATAVANCQAPPGGEQLHSHGQQRWPGAVGSLNERQQLGDAGKAHFGASDHVQNAQHQTPDRGGEHDTAGIEPASAPSQRRRDAIDGEADCTGHDADDHRPQQVDGVELAVVERKATDGLGAQHLQREHGGGGGGERGQQQHRHRGNRPCRDQLHQWHHPCQRTAEHGCPAARRAPLPSRAGSSTARRAGCVPPAPRCRRRPAARHLRGPATRHRRVRRSRRPTTPATPARVRRRRRPAGRGHLQDAGRHGRARNAAPAPAPTRRRWPSR
jgi:hypothetical protein